MSTLEQDRAEDAPIIKFASGITIIHWRKIVYDNYGFPFGWETYITDDIDREKALTIERSGQLEITRVIEADDPRFIDKRTGNPSGLNKS